MRLTRFTNKCPIPGRTYLEYFLKDACEVALVVKAACQCNIGKRVVRLEEGSGPGSFFVQEISLDRNGVDATK